MILLLITILTIILIMLNFKLNLMASDPAQVYLSQTNDLRNTISSILSEPEYQILVNNVPGQKIFNISGDPPTLTQSLIEGDPSKIDDLKDDFPVLLKVTNELINSLNEYISMAKESQGVYTPEKLNTFLVYYNNMLNNIIVIKKYLEK